MITRAALPADAEALSRIAVEVFNAAYAHAFSNPEVLEPYLAQTFAPEVVGGAIDSDPELLRVVVVESRVAGFVWLSQGDAPRCVDARPAIEVSKLYLLPEFHGSGAADRLMDDALETARARHNAGVWLCVWERNLRARRFYERWGFRSVGTVLVTVGEVDFTDLVLTRAVG